MPVKPLDTLIAHKVINLSELSGTEKRIAGAIIESFNRRTGRCDPSLGRIAELVGVSRRTVIRAVEKFARIGMITKVRHGGRFQTNSYAPVWEYFWRMNEAWDARMKNRTHAWPSNVSPAQGQTCHTTGAETGTQTCPRNLQKETCSNSVPKPEAPRPGRGPSGIQGAQDARPPAPRSTFRPTYNTGALEAARSAAERRWTRAVEKHFGKDPTVHAEVIGKIGADLAKAATDAEMKRPGSGFRMILDALAASRLPVALDKSEAAP